MLKINNITLTISDATLFVQHLSLASDILFIRTYLSANSLKYQKPQKVQTLPAVNST